MDTGPVVRGLEEALKTFNVERQAYWSGAFVGNHVHRILKVMVIYTCVYKHYIPGADPGGVRWVRTNPLQYQLFLRAELILGCKHTENSIAAGWDIWPTRWALRRVQHR